MGRSSFDQVSAFLRQRSASAQVPADVQEDAEVLVRRYDRVRSLDEAFGEVELSPYMRSLLRTRTEPSFNAENERASAAAGG
jgi:hypothetical protein